MGENIGIVGAGTARLQQGLYLKGGQAARHARVAEAA